MQVSGAVGWPQAASTWSGREAAPFLCALETGQGCAVWLGRRKKGPPTGEPAGLEQLGRAGGQKSALLGDKQPEILHAQDDLSAQPFTKLGASYLPARLPHGGGAFSNGRYDLVVLADMHAPMT